MLFRFLAACRGLWADSTLRATLVTAVAVVATATTFYTLVEKWSVLDSLYFSVVTALTIGYGDFTPSTALSKIFTVVYALCAVGLFVTVVANLARRLVSQHSQRTDRHHDRHHDR